MDSEEKLVKECLSVTEVTDANLSRVLNLLQETSKILQQPPATASGFAKKFNSDIMSFCLAFLDLDPIVREESLTPASLRIVPLPIDFTATVNYHLYELQLSALVVISDLTHRLSEGDVFKMWMIFLPDSSLSPYRLSLSDLFETVRDSQVKLALANCISAFFKRVGRLHLGVVDQRSTSLSFTPLYMPLAGSLEKTHALILKSLVRSMEVPFVTAGSRALIAMLKKCPYKKLDKSILPQLLDYADELSMSKNPVAQIAGMNLYLGITNVDDDFYAKEAAVNGS